MKALILSSLFGIFAHAATPKVGEPAPTFTLPTHTGETFDLKGRKGQWTVLFFYPKADTPGCTKQACAYRDSVEKIRSQGGDIFGISLDTVADQAAFHKKHGLKFTLLADADGKVIDLYGTKMPVVKMSKRWTFLIDPNLVVRHVEQNVDPAKDAEKIAAKIAELKTKP